MEWVAGWLLFSIVLAGCLAGCTRRQRRQLAILLLFPTVSTVALIAGHYASAGSLYDIRAYAAFVLIVTALAAVLAPSKPSRTAVLVTIPLSGLTFFLVVLVSFVLTAQH